VQHGFLRDRRGTIQTIDVSFTGNQGTVTWAINAAGEISGYYIDANGNTQAFVRSPAGQITQVDVPGATFGAESENVNNGGVIDGSSQDANGTIHGFVRQADGSITVFDAPGAGSGFGIGTITVDAAGNHRGLNERGDLTGATLDSNLTWHGFLRAHDGTTISFDVPESGVGNGNGTQPVSLNSSGTICGGFADNNGLTHGFVRYRNGSIVPFDAPGVTSYTAAVVVNDPGDIAGLWMDANGVAHAFIMEPQGAQ
jgi:hypothetical protein